MRGCGRSGPRLRIENASYSHRGSEIVSYYGTGALACGKHLYRSPSRSQGNLVFFRCSGSGVDLVLSSVGEARKSGSQSDFSRRGEHNHYVLRPDAERPLGRANGGQTGPRRSCPPECAERRDFEDRLRQSGPKRFPPR